MAALHGNMHIGEVNQLKMYQEAPLQTHSVRNSDGGTSDGTHYLNHANPVPGADKCMGMLTHRRKRINYTQKQVEVLENAFSAVKYPDVFIREGLEAVTGVPEPRIQVWFQNRRAKSRRQLNSSVSANAANAQAANPPLGQQRGIALQGAFENRPGAVVHQMRDSGLQDNFRPSVHQNTAATRRTSRPTRPRSHHEPSVSWRMNQGQMHQHMQSVNASKSNACLFPNEHHRNMENNTAASQGPTVLVEYDNFPPNRTIGPEMRVVIPPLPTQNSCHASTSKANGCQMQYPQVRASGARFIPFPPDQFSKGTRP